MLTEKWKWAVIVACVIGLGVLAAGGLFYHLTYASKQIFLPGTQIASVPVEGHSTAEVIGILERKITPVYNTPVVFSNGDYRYETSLGELVVPLDFEAITKQLYEKESHRSWSSRAAGILEKQSMNYAVAVEYRSDVVEKLVGEWQNAAGKPAVDARLEMDKAKGLMVVPEQVGLVVNRPATWDQMPVEWDLFQPLQVQIQWSERIPAVTARDLDSMGELSSYTTWYKVTEVDRTHNLTVAAATINGFMLKPGQVFSFNQVVGPRTDLTGFRDAKIIVGDKFELGTGGGICQVSSTLYNACLLAGLEIVERYNHNLLVSYIPPGLDATVSYGLQDFRFKNNSDSPVYIRSVAGGGQLSVNIYGNLAFKKNTKLTYVIDEQIPFQEVREIKADLKTGEEVVDHAGIPGYVVRSYRTYYDGNGKSVSSELLARDYYKPLNKLIYTGPPAAGQPLPQPPEKDKNKTETPKPDQPGQPEKEPAIDPGSDGYRET